MSAVLITKTIRGSKGEGMSMQRLSVLIRLSHSQCVVQNVSSNSQADQSGWMMTCDCLSAASFYTGLPLNYVSGSCLDPFDVGFLLYNACLLSIMCRCSQTKYIPPASLKHLRRQYVNEILLLFSSLSLCFHLNVIF